MKITKTASGKTEVRMSKKEWKNLGKLAQWGEFEGLPTNVRQHVEDVAQESGYEEEFYSNNETIDILGHRANVFYNESTSSPFAWRCFVKGVGETIGESKEECIENMKVKLGAI